MKNNGGQAFPNEYWEGMSLRDYIACKAMQSFVSRNGMKSSSPKKIAEYSYNFADAMLAERSKRE